MRDFAALMFMAGLGLASAASAQPAVPVVDAAIVEGVEVACTGVGESREDPRWLAFPVRLEFSDHEDKYLAGAEVRVSDQAGRPLLRLHCADGPWLLLKLPPGSYRIEARPIESAAAPRTATVRAPAAGQVRYVFRFPDA